jgi:hypothetical protein
VECARRVITPSQLSEWCGRSPLVFLILEDQRAPALRLWTLQGRRASDHLRGISIIFAGDELLLHKEIGIARQSYLHLARGPRTIGVPQNG